MSVWANAKQIMCRFGRHSAGPDEVWNRGYYFSQCRSCGADLVRTAAGKWHVPKGRKIVWKPKKPRGRAPGE